MNRAIHEKALRTIERAFGPRFVRDTPGEKGSTVRQPLASVFPESVGEVRFLTRLAARYRLPLVARGAGTALYVGAPPQALAVSFDAMRKVRIPESGEDWIEVEAGVTWGDLEERLRARGRGLTVYPTSAPRATVGGWLAENGLGVGSFEYGWLLANVLSVETVLAGGDLETVEGETLRQFVGSRGRAGFMVKTRLVTRPAAEDVPVGAVFRSSEELAGAVRYLYENSVPLWHLAFLNPPMARARGLKKKHVLFGAYPEERSARVEPALRKALEGHRGRFLPSPDVQRLWEQRFFPVGSSGSPPRPGRALVTVERLVRTLEKLDRGSLSKVAIQGTVAGSGEVSLLAFSVGVGAVALLDLEPAADVGLLQVAGRSWRPGRRKRARPEDEVFREIT